MPETIGLLLLSAAAPGALAAGSGVAGLGTFAGTGIFIGGVQIATVASVIGAATIVGVSVGLQLALSNPSVPRPEAGAIPIKQAVAPRTRGYWNCRLAGVYMLFTAVGQTSYDVFAFHHGKVESVHRIWLDDDSIGVTPDISAGGNGVVGGPGGRYAASTFEVKLGAPSQVVSSLLISDPSINGSWTSAMRGDGVAYGVLVCGAPGDPEAFANLYPRGLPTPSIEAKCSPVWDPRDPAQDENDESTWVASPNPVLQLIDYLTRVDGGMGLPREEILPAERLAEWMIEADLCDDDGSGQSYQSGGFYRFDNAPEDVVPKMLAACDGWLSEAGDGTLALTVGVYRAPEHAPITEKHILGFSIDYGSTDEQLVNQLDVKFTDPDEAYAEAQIDPIRDEAAISLAGRVRSRPLDLSWVQDPDQATRLGNRAMLRVNPPISGKLVTTLYGLTYLGKRWVKVQYPYVRGLEDCVIEIQDKAEIDILGGTVTFPFSVVDPVALAEF